MTKSSTEAPSSVSGESGNVAVVRRLYEARVVALADWLLLQLPSWVPAAASGGEPDFATLHDET